jgi:acylphosphatase
MKTWEMIARGRVQGVGFRWFVQRTALHHSLNGYVQNRFDGSVYIIAQGETHLLENFRLAIESGNRLARVANLETTEIDSAKKYDDFEIR